MKMSTNKTESEVKKATYFSLAILSSKIRIHNILTTKEFLEKDIRLLKESLSYWHVDYTELEDNKFVLKDMPHYGNGGKTFIFNLK